MEWEQLAREVCGHSTGLSWRIDVHVGGEERLEEPWVPGKGIWVPGYPGRCVRKGVLPSVLCSRGC